MTSKIKQKEQSMTSKAKQIEVCDTRRTWPAAWDRS